MSKRQNKRRRHKQGTHPKQSARQSGTAKRSGTAQGKRTTSHSQSTAPVLLIGAGIAVVGTVAFLVAVLWWSAGDSPPPPEGAVFVGGDLHSLVADPARPDTLYVGGHAAVGVSNDAGANWEPVPSLDNADAMGWAFSGTGVFVSGHPGLTVASDPDEATFLRYNDGLPDTDIHALGSGGSTLFAAGPRVGVIASTDGGATWETRSTEMGQGFFGRILVDADTATLLASDTSLGPVHSADGGRTWTSLRGLPNVWLSSTPDLLIASGPEGAFILVEGIEWDPLTVPDGALLVEADPHTEGRLFAAGHTGSHAEVWVSTDTGQTWARP